MLYSGEQMNITIFSVPRSFEDLHKIIQTNSINSWLQLKPKPEIILFGDDLGVAQFAKQKKIIHISKIKKNKFGTPRIDDAFNIAKKLAKNDYLCYINSDIIIDPKLLEVITALSKHHKSFLAVGRRWNLKIEKKINFSNKNWYKDIKQKALKHNKLYSPTGVDMFIFDKNFFSKIPKFAIGRTVWDNWLMYYAKSKNLPLIEITDSLTLVHQDHSYKKFKTDKKHFRKGREGKENLKAAGGYYYMLTTKDVDYRLDEKLNLKKNELGLFYKILSRIKRSGHKIFDKYLYLGG